MRSYLSAILGLALLLTGCGGGSGNEKQASEVNTTQPPATPGRPLTPTEAFRAYNDAKRNKDAAAVKSLLSKGSLELTEKTAAQRGESTDTVVLSGQTFLELPPIRNEKITGDTATIEIQNPENGGWEEWYLVKEDGTWKNALDLLVANTMKRLANAMRQPPPANSKPGNSVKK